MQYKKVLTLYAIIACSTVRFIMSSDSQPVVITNLDGSREYNMFEEVATPYVVKYNKFPVVTPLDISGGSEFYQKTRTSGSSVMDPELPEEKLGELGQLKSYICEGIIRSPLFEKRYQCEVALDMQDSDATYDKISHDYPNIVEAHQSGSESAKSQKFVNSYVLRNVEKSQPEEVFSCFAQKHGSKDVALYFISREYVTERPVLSGSRIYNMERNVTGRFIYENIVDKGDLTAIAFAEDPPDGNIARPRSDNWQPQLESDLRDTNSSNCLYSNFLARSTGVGTYDYIKLQLSYFIIDSKGAYKGMSMFYKIRLCGLVFGSRLYRNKVKFVPEEENIKPGLVRKTVKFLHLYYKKQISNVWMIPCKVEYTPKKVPINRYIVRGEPVHHSGFFICGDTHNGSTFVEGILMHEDKGLPIYL